MCHLQHPYTAHGQRCAHFSSVNTVEEKKQHKKGKKAPHNVSTQRVKGDEDAELYARIGVGEEIFSPMPSHSSLKIGPTSWG